MSTSLVRKSYTPLTIDNYQFTEGGEEDYVLVDVVDDVMRGLGVPGKSMYIENHGGGSGINKLYYQISEDGYRWSDVMSLRPGRYEGFSQDDGIRIWLLKVWASNANVSFTTRITPGIWNEDELLELGLLSPPTIEIPTNTTSSSPSYPTEEPPTTEVEITVPADQIK